MSRKRKQSLDLATESPPRTLDPALVAINAHPPELELVLPQPPSTAISEHSPTSYDAHVLYAETYGVTLPFHEPGTRLEAYDMLWGLTSATTDTDSSSLAAVSRGSISSAAAAVQRETNTLTPARVDLDWISADPILLSRMKVLPEHVLLKSFLDTLLLDLASQGETQSWIDAFRSRAAIYSPLRHACLAISSANARMSAVTKHLIHPDLPMIHLSYSLQALQQDLADQYSTHSDDNIMTGLLLSTFELVRGESRDMFQAHMHGVRKIMESRGPLDFRKSTNNRCFLAVQMNEIRRCLEEHTPTVFAQPQWVKVSECSQALGYNKFAGNKLNTFLLRLTCLTATNRKSDKQARLFEAELLEERRKRLTDPVVVYNDALCARYSRAQKIQLTLSPFGHSLCYDEPWSGIYLQTLAAITFDAAILHLHLTYRKMKTEQDLERASSIVKCIQYMMADPKNQVTRMVGDFVFPILTALKYVEKNPTLQAWISHSIHHTGIPLWSQHSRTKPLFQSVMDELVTGVQDSLKL